MKTAYELALERMESQGIERPDADSLTPETREKMAEVRSKAQARLAEVEIFHRKASSEAADPLTRERLENEYRIDRSRIEEDRDQALERLRSG
ncbi:MAG: hypothetical protein K8J08_22690 [Thermoanaerobaculia bacterium]|nr:hypothetical protein [Thermoanaerobaculia bacterium]